MTFTFKPSAEEIAWAAGFFEGEGSFFRNLRPPRKDGSRAFYSRASVTQKDRSLLERFQRIVGFGIIMDRSEGVGYWQTTKRGEVSQLLELFRPWLSERRLATAERLLVDEAAQVIRPKRSHV